jgi:2,4-dienoyl-CoA reductase-like NADH-dependent reductase (Old Yellow Enzyme family)
MNRHMCYVGQPYVDEGQLPSHRSTTSKPNYGQKFAVQHLKIMALLFQPLPLREIELKNRIVVSPMCQYSSEDGFANDWHLVHLGSRAVGGAGLIIVEASAVAPEGRITPSDLGIWKDEHIPFLKRITDFVQASGTVPGIQLAHAGRKASHRKPWEGGTFLTDGEGAWQTLAPSAIPFKPEEPAPLAMSRKDIEKLIRDFKAASIRAFKAGFKILEIHAAHGYLINEFLSPISNQRNDEYGGAFDNRVRLLIEIIKAIRGSWPDEHPLFVRISATDWVDGGWTIDDSVKLAGILKNEGVDLVDCSSGGTSPFQKIPTGPLYQVPFAERIKKETGMRTGAVGLITTAEQAEQILYNQQADLIVLARQLLRDPYFPLHAAKELDTDIPWPSQYERAKR